MKKHQKKNYIYIIPFLVLFWTIIWFLNYKKTQPQVPVIDNTKDVLTIMPEDYVEWPLNAKVVLIEYLDFECEACRAYFPLVKDLKKKYWNDLAIVYRYFPLPWHKNSLTSATAVEAAWIQGKFFEMKDLLFQNQGKWWESSFTDMSIFTPYAESIWIDIEKYKIDIQSESTLKRILRDRNSWTLLWITWTPSFFLNGVKINNPKSKEDFETIINAAIINSPKDIWVKVHEHADLKVYLNGKILDLWQDKYQSTDEKPLDTDTHLHDGNGNNIHKHRTKKTLWDLFTSIGISFSKDCFLLDTKEKFCNNWTSNLKLFVNGKENTLFSNYELVDLDKILISFWSDSQEEIKKQIASISDQACMYSEKCPERWKPPTENCVVWLGGDC